MPQTAPPAPTTSVAYSSDLDAPAEVFSFNTDGAVTQPGVANFPVGGLTLSCWLNSTNTTTGVVLLSYDATPASNPHRLSIKTPSDLEIGVGAQTTGPTGVSLADGVWHHLAVTITPSDATHFAVGVYKDGVPCWFAQATLAGSVGLEAGGDLVLGKGVTGEPGLTGQMSEFRLLNVVQTPTEIMSGMQARMNPQDSSVVILWALTSPQTSGQLSGNGSFGTALPPLQYRINRSVVAEFTESTPGSTYDLQWSSGDRTYYPLLTGLPHAPVPLPDFQINNSYTARVRAVLNGVVGSWSQPATALTLDLGQPLTTLSQPADAQLQTSWQAVDQSLLYRLSFYKNGGTTPEPPSGAQTGTTFDLSTLVNGSDSWTYNVQARAEGANGPPSAVVSLTAVPTLQFIYDWAESNGVLRASWTGADDASYHYLKVSTGGSVEVASPLLPASTSEYIVGATVSEGQSYTAALRALQAGSIGAWTSAAQVVIHQLFGPIVGALSADGTAHTISIPWTAPSGPAGQTFVAELWAANASAPLSTIDPATSPQVFTNPAIIDGSSFTVRVRAAADNSYGRWSEWQSITVGGVPQVTGVVARSDSSGNVVVSWQPVAGLANVSYIASITGPGVSFSSAPVSENTVTLLQTQTQVQNGATYSVTVQGSATGHASGPVSAPVSVTIEVDPNPTPQQGTASDPVNVASGAFLYQNDDLVVGSVVPLIFSTYYNSRLPTPSENPIYSGKPLGNRWNHSYNTRLARDPQGQIIYVLWGNLKTDAFNIPAAVTGSYPGSGNSAGSFLSLGSDLLFTLKMADQSQYRFDFKGNLLSITDTFGHQTALAYQNNHLATVTDVATTRKLTFTYTGDYLQRVADDTGRHVDFTYDGPDLKTVADVMGQQRTFNYTGTSLVETITDQRNNLAAKNTYTNNQVTRQQDARALASGQDYGTSFSYQSTTIAGLPVIITSVVDRASHAITYQSLAANGALLSTLYNLDDGNIQVESYTYDAFNNVLTETLYVGPSAGYAPGMGNTTTHTYDGNGNQLTTIIPLGGGNIRALTRTYDDANNLKTSAFYEGPQSAYQPSAGNVTRFDYNPDNTLATMTDPLNRTLAFTYWDGSIAGLIRTYTDVLNNSYSFEYENGLLSRATNPFNEKIEYEWDTAGRHTQTRHLAADNSVLKTTLITYYDNSLPETRSIWMAGQPQAEPFLTQYFYDPNGNLTRVLDNQSVETTFVYDPNNSVISILYPSFHQAQRTTGIAYDRDDYLQTTTYSPTVREDYVSDVLGRLVSFSDAKQQLYSYARTMTTSAAAPYSLRETRTWPTLSATPGVVYTDRVTRDPAGRITNTTDRAGNATDITYSTTTDAATGTLQTVMLVTLPPASSGATRYTLTYVFDALGRPVSLTDQNTNTTGIAYSVVTDPVSGTHLQLVTSTDPLGNKTADGFDTLGRLALHSRGNPDVLPPLVRQTAYQYDVLARILLATDSQGTAPALITQFAYAYDPASKLIQVSIGRPGETTGNTLQYYNGDGRLVKQVDPSGTTTLREYAPWGALASYLNGRGQLFTYEFDDAARLHSVEQPGGSVLTHTLDANGNREASQVDTGPAIARTFDEWNRMSSRTDPATGAVAFAYWPTDQLKTLTYPGGDKSVQYAVDGLQRLLTVTDWANRVTTYGYLPTGQLNAVSFGNGATANYSYDTAGRPTGLLQTAGGLVVARYSTVLDALGQPATASAILPLPPTFPANGQTLVYNAANQISTEGGVALAYDDDGDYLGAAGQPPSLEYDAYGRVTGVSQARTDHFSYDPDGLRTTIVLGDDTRHYVFDVNGFESAQVQRGDPVRALIAAEVVPTISGSVGSLPVSRGANQPVLMERAIDRVLEVRDASQSVISRYVHGLGLIAQEDAAGNYVVFQGDLNGNVVALTDAQGKILDRYNYDPYGQPMGQDGTTTNPFRYAGCYGVLDDGNGFLYARARSYSPALMRFLQPDYFLGTPFRPQTLNRYVYAAGNPLQGVDPLGLDTMKNVGIGLGVGLGALGLGVGIYKLVKSGFFSSIGSFFSNLFSGGRSGSRPEIELPELEPDGPSPENDPSGENLDPEMPEAPSGSPNSPLLEAPSSSRVVDLGRSVFGNRFRALTSEETSSLTRIGQILKSQ